MSKTYRTQFSTYEWFPVCVGSVAVEVHFFCLCLPHVAEPKVDAVSGQTHRSESQMGTERHCLRRAERSNIFQLATNDHTVLFHFLLSPSTHGKHVWPAGCCCCSESGGFAGTSVSSLHLHCGSASPRERRPHPPALQDPEGTGSSGRPPSPGVHRK